MSGDNTSPSSYSRREVLGLVTLAALSGTVRERTSKDEETAERVGEQTGDPVVERATDPDEPTESPEDSDVTDGFGGDEFGTGEFGV